MQQPFAVEVSLLDVLLAPGIDSLQQRLQLGLQANHVFIINQNVRTGLNHPAVVAVMVVVDVV